MDKKKGISDIISNYDENTKRLYSHIAKLEKETTHKSRRKEVQDVIKHYIEQVIK